jgi:hypothetical protein
MRLRNLIVVPLLALTAFVVPTRAADPTPTVLVRIKSIDGLMADAKYLAGLAGQEEAVKQVDGMIPAVLGPKGLGGTGLDTTRPWGLYAILDPQIPNSPVVALIPVSDEKAFIASLNMLAGFAQGANVTIAKGDDGVYTVSTPAAPVEVLFTIADGYAYITAKSDFVGGNPKQSISAGKRLSAAKLLPADEKTILAVTARLDTIDPQFKQMALGQLENKLAEVKEQKAQNETPAQSKLKVELVDHISKQIRSLLTDGEAVDFRLALDRKTDDISAQLSLAAKPGSPLAKLIADQGSQVSRFGRLGEAAVQGALKVAIPEALRGPFNEVVEEGFNEGQGRQKDAIKKDLAQKVFSVLAPTMKAGQLDVFFGIVGPNADGKFTFAGGVKVVDAAKVEQLARDLTPMIPDPKAKEAIAFDAETIGDVKVHKITAYDLDAEGTRMFGPNATARIAFPGDAVMVAFGADTADVIKQMVAATGKPGGPFRVEASVSRAIGLDKDDGARGKKAAAAAFAGNPTADMIRFSIDGGPALRLRASMKGQFITFGVKMDEAAKGK